MFIFIFIFIFFIYFFFCGGFCHTLKWNSQGFTYVPHPNPPSHLETCILSRVKQTTSPGWMHETSVSVSKSRQTLISFSLLLRIHFFWDILRTRWTFHKLYIISIWGKMIGCEKIALLFPIKWTSYIQSICKFPWFSKSGCLFTVYWKNVLICCTWLISFKTK